MDGLSKSALRPYLMNHCIAANDAMGQNEKCAQIRPSSVWRRRKSLTRSTLRSSWLIRGALPSVWRAYRQALRADRWPRRVQGQGGDIEDCNDFDNTADSVRHRLL